VEKAEAELENFKIQSNEAAKRVGFR